MLLLRRSIPSRRLIGVVVAAVVLAGACSGDDDSAADGIADPPTTVAAPGDATTSSSSPEPSPESTAGSTTADPSSNTGTVSVIDLRAGDCFDASEPSTDPTEVEEVDLVSCDEEHGNEVFTETAFESAGPAYPGEDELIEYATRFCVDGFEAFVGLPYADSVYTVSHFWPTVEAWESTDDRAILCVLFRKNGPMRGSAEGTAE